MWENTLLVVFSDNGGAIFLNSPRENIKNGVTGGGNNYPLRGGKFGNHEGGIRVNAFVAGGYVPLQKRGTVENGLIAMEDWYTTFCSIAGCSIVDESANSVGLPKVDGVNMLPLLLGETNISPRREVT
jgi:arylsulfatase I/J